MQEYLFDLNGFLILRGALSPEDVAEMNATYDAIEAAGTEGKSWFGHVAVNNSGRQEGMIFEQLYEAGPVWERLVDHPAWFRKVAHFVGSDDPENSTTITACCSSTSASARSGAGAARSGCIRAATWARSGRSTDITRAGSTAARSSC
jgi:Phytanoyl-CoA dioxygenase (PhyH)